MCAERLTTLLSGAESCSSLSGTGECSQPFLSWNGSFFACSIFARSLCRNWVELGGGGYLCGAESVFVRAAQLDRTNWGAAEYSRVGGQRCVAEIEQGGSRTPRCGGSCEYRISSWVIYGLASSPTTQLVSRPFTNCYAGEMVDRLTWAVCSLLVCLWSVVQWCGCGMWFN